VTSVRNRIAVNGRKGRRIRTGRSALRLCVGFRQSQHLLTRIIVKVEPARFAHLDQFYRYAKGCRGRTGAEMILFESKFRECEVLSGALSCGFRVAQQKTGAEDLSQHRSGCSASTLGNSLPGGQVSARDPRSEFALPSSYS
jgi:hypothetical protein